MPIPTDPDLAELAQHLGDTLRRLRLLLASAESCTGGWVGKVVTDVPGSSHWYERGFITYTNQAKQELLGVPQSVIEQYGAVSEQTARAMLEGVLRHSHADVVLSITGIAGPGGGTASKPVGLVWFGWGRRSGELQIQSQQFDGDREAVRRQAVFFSLATLEKFLIG